MRLTRESEAGGREGGFEYIINAAPVHVDLDLPVVEFERSLDLLHFYFIDHVVDL